MAPNEKVSVNLALNNYQFDPSVSYCVENPPPLAYTRDRITSVLLCKQECQLNVTLRTSGCAVLMPNTNISSDRFCSIRKNLEIFYYKKMIYQDEFRSEIFECQQARCPKLCEANLYIPFAVYSKVTPRNGSNFSISMVEIYFGELAYTLASFIRMC